MELTKEIVRGAVSALRDLLVDVLDDLDSDDLFDASVKMAIFAQVTEKVWQGTYEYADQNGQVPTEIADHMNRQAGKRVEASKLDAETPVTGFYL